MDEKEKQCYLASFNGKRGAERNPTNYQRRDDGQHIYKNEEYYEWWYIDASFDNGYHIVLTFHYRNAFLNPMVPSLQLMIYKPDGTQTARYALCPEEEIYAGPDYCDVRMGDNFLKDMGDGRYELHMLINGVGARLTLKNIVPGWKLGTGFNYKNEEAGWVAGWTVPVPHARVEGELYLKNETVPVKGMGYHDHNWGNYRCHKTFSGWYWGRIHTDQYALDYSCVFPRDPEAPLFTPLLIARGSELVLSSTIMEMKLEDRQKDEKTGRNYAKKLMVTTDVLDVKMNLTIETNRLVESMQLPKSAGWDQFYFRFLADYSLDLEIDGEKDQVRGKMLHEYMVL
jgi:predicted secreted hydrolase